MKPDQLSQTAAFVAIKFYGLTRIPDFVSLFDDSIPRFYNHLVRSLPAPLSYYHYWLKFGWVRRLYIWSEELLLPGDLLHVVARKWYIQRMTSTLVDEGYEQIIVLGAGFDHLAYFFSQEGLSCFEFDVPYMADFKRQFLEENYPDNTHPDIITSYLPKNKLGTQFSELPQINPHKKTVIVAEGFFDYLAPQIVRQSLDHIHSYFSHNTALITTHFALDELPYFQRQVFQNSVRLVGEQLRFNTSADDFNKFMSDGGFSICQLHDSQQISETISARISTSLPMLKGFYILKAKISS